MSHSTLASTLILATALVFVGLISGLLYFRALRRTVDLLVCRQRWLQPAMLTMARIVCALLVLGLIAQLGAMALVAGFAGFASARMIALREVRRAD